MKLANTEIEKYVYGLLGNSFNDSINDWNYFLNPPKSVSGDRYVWCAVNLLQSDGTKDDFIGQYLLELTIVSKAGADFTDNQNVDRCGSYLGNLLDVRGRQISLATFNLTSANLVAVEATTEHEADKMVIVRKLIFNILAQEL